jgi:hypothetical protein
MPLTVLMTTYCLKTIEDNENNNSNVECDSSDEDFRGFCDQKKLHTTLPLF